jgi:hypothetical protein
MFLPHQSERRGQRGGEGGVVGKWSVTRGEPSADSWLPASLAAGDHRPGLWLQDLFSIRSPCFSVLTSLLRDSLTELRTTELRTKELRTTRISAAELRTGQLRTPEIRKTKPRKGLILEQKSIRMTQLRRTEFRKRFNIKKDWNSNGQTSKNFKAMYLDIKIVNFETF